MRKKKGRARKGKGQKEEEGKREEKGERKGESLPLLLTLLLYRLKKEQQREN